MSFFSEFQSKFPSKYSGQYIEVIIKSIASARLEDGDKLPKVLASFFQCLSIDIRSVVDVSVSSESCFPGKDQGRRADLKIAFSRKDGADGVIYIEIKVDDQIIKSKEEEGNDQLDDYLGLLELNDYQDKYFVLLTAHPIDARHSKKIKNQNGRAKHLFIGDYCRSFIDDKDLSIEKMLVSYLTEKGYLMFVPEKEDKDDFLSFMALNFLIHTHGHGRVVSDRKISNGPVVFSNLVKNWQLISYRLNSYLKTKGVPAVRYLPEQVMKEGACKSLMDSGSSFVEHRMKMRQARAFGRMWLFSEVVVNDGHRLGWAVIYSIENAAGDKDSEVSPVRCQHVVSLRYGNKGLFEFKGSEMSFDKHSSMNAELIIDELITLIRRIEKANSMDLLES